MRPPLFPRTKSELPRFGDLPVGTRFRPASRPSGPVWLKRAKTKAVNTFTDKASNFTPQRLVLPVDGAAPVAAPAAESRTKAPPAPVVKFKELAIGRRFWMTNVRAAFSVYEKCGPESAVKPGGGTTKMGAATRVYPAPDPKVGEVYATDAGVYYRIDAVLPGAERIKTTMTSGAGSVRSEHKRQTFDLCRLVPLAELPDAALARFGESDDVVRAMHPDQTVAAIPAPPEETPTPVETPAVAATKGEGDWPKGLYLPTKIVYTGETGDILTDIIDDPKPNVVVTLEFPPAGRAMTSGEIDRVVDALCRGVTPDRIVTLTLALVDRLGKGFAVWMGK